MGNIERCSCGKTLTEAERLIGPVIVERERWRESARVSEDEILRLRDQLAGAVDRVAELEVEASRLRGELDVMRMSRDHWRDEAAMNERTGGQ